MRRGVAIAATLTATSLFLASCASIVSDNDSTTYIQTEPETARCELHGQDFVRVVNTPDSIQLPAEAAPITIACKAEGYKTTTANLDTSMDGWIVGNLLFGRVIGLAVDAARGAGQKYPAQVMVALEPEAFDSIAHRDRWYDERRAAIEAKWDEQISKAKNSCNTNPERHQECASQAEELGEQSDKEIEAFEERRLSATVSSGA